MLHGKSVFRIISVSLSGDMGYQISKKKETRNELRRTIKPQEWVCGALHSKSGLGNKSKKTICVS